VVSQPLAVLGEPVGIRGLDGSDDPDVHLAAPLVEQATVRDLVGEGVLEREFQIGKHGGLVEELRSLEEGDATLERFLGKV
jgi:hypothetical protein